MTMTPPTRRALLAWPAAALATLTALTSSSQALALDLGFGLGLPKLEDLRPKWDAVGLGTSADLVIQLMGGPNGRTETQTMGVPHLTLDWKDIRGYRYTARFLGGRLYAKEMTDNH